MPGVQTYTLIDQTTLTTSAASVTFSSIPQIYEDLIVEMVSPLNNGNAYAFRFNSDTGTNYSWTELWGTGSTVTSTRSSNQSYCSFAYVDFNNWNTHVANIMSYSNPSVNKTFISQTSPSTRVAGTFVGLWRSTASITSVTVLSDSVNNVIAANTTLRLYGIVG